MEFVVSLEDAQVLLHLARKSQNYDSVVEFMIRCLDEWNENQSCLAADVVLFGLQNDRHTCQPIVEQIYNQLIENHNVSSYLTLLRRCSNISITDPRLVDHLWSVLGTTTNSETAHQISQILVLQLKTFVEQHHCARFEAWWESITLCLRKPLEKDFSSAALTAWLAAITYLDSTEIEPVVINKANEYFQILETYTAKASKMALKILGKTLSLIKAPLDCSFMTYDPAVSGIQSVWSRYISVLEILGIDTSVHQTLDTLPDFAALLSSGSPIPANWLITLINVGVVASNTETIRALVMQLLLEAKSYQLWALAKSPVYVAEVLFPRFLMTSNFVMMNGRCLHSERLERFVVQYMHALLHAGQFELRSFMANLAQYLLEHCHGFEAPRVLVMEAIANTLPSGSLSPQETQPLLAAAKATVATYTSRAMAELYLETVKKVVIQCGSSDCSAIQEDSVIDQESVELHRIKSLPANASSSPLLKLLNPLEEWNSTRIRLIAQSEVQAALITSLEHPTALSQDERSLLSRAIELAFDYVDASEYELCELAFSAFNDFRTRLAALRSYKRSNFTEIPVDRLVTLWCHIKEATLRIVDRELHHEFIDLLTSPEVLCHDAERKRQAICCEIVEMSVLRRNLLIPLALGLQRFKYSEAWVMPVMVKIFAFICSKEYTVQLEDQVAVRFGVYEKYWGHPESYARGIAAAYLKGNLDCTDLARAARKESVNDTTRYIMELAQLETKITGSFDNIDAHRRVIYYQSLILLQDQWTRELAVEILSIVRTSLEHEPNPPVRLHAEWLIGLIGITHLNLEFTPFVMSQIEELVSDAGVPPRILGSLIRTCLLLYYSSKIHNVSSSDHDRIGESLLERLLPLATSNKAVVRHRAISAIYNIARKGMSPKSMESLVSNIAKTNESGVKGSNYQNETYLWDLLDTRLGTVCSTVCCTIFDREMPNTLYAEDFTLAKVNESDLGAFWQPSNQNTEFKLPEIVAYREKAVREAVCQSYGTDFSNYVQTKSGTFDVEYKVRRTSLVVVATLCDKPVNLGAITRLSDALGVSKLVISSKEVMSDNHFKSTALTAEKWIPIDEVAEPDLEMYLRKMKANGYSLVGIEQTDSSKILRSNLQFPDKTLLLMGHEKQGVPANILMLLDTCVEIEQLGYVRSMNIQTATAVVVQAYNQCHGPHVTEVSYRH